MYHVAPQEMEGLRNQYINSFLPPRRKQTRRPRELQGPPRTKLHFARYPIVDLATPSPELCASSSAS